MGPTYEPSHSREGANSDPSSGTNIGLLLTINKGAGSFVEQLTAQLRNLIQCRGLPAGQVLPPSRTLADEIGVSRGVVVRAYDRLRHEGWLAARQGSQTVVSDLLAPERRETRKRTWSRDLHPEVSDLGNFPRAAWSRSFSRAISVLPTPDLGYRANTGLAELKDELAAYLTRTRRVVVDADNLLICHGVLHAFRALVEVLEQGERRGPIAVPRISHPTVGAVLRECGGPVQWLDVDDDGICIPEAEGVAANSSILVNSGFHYPLGVSTTADRLQAALDRYDVVIEEDMNNDLRHSGLGAPALQGRAPARVAYAGSVSRSLAPALRIGWVVVPPRLTAEAAAAVARHGGAPSTLEQATLADLISTGELDRHLRRVRQGYKRRAEALRQALTSEAPELDFCIPPSGFQATITLPTGASEARVVKELAASGIRVFGGASHILHGSALPPMLVFGYATLPTGSMSDFVGAVRDAVAVSL